MEPHIDKVGRQLDRCLKPSQFKEAKSRIVTPKHPIDFRCMPCGIPQFEAEAMSRGKRPKKPLKARDIAAPMRGQLKENRTELLAQPVDNRHKPRQSAFRVFELFSMRNIPAPFHGKPKISGGAETPPVGRLFAGKPIKAVVDFY
jgi:hypothetical protein